MSTEAPMNLRLRPGLGLVVRDPETRQPLAEEGELKPATTYWLRRLADGDAKLVTDNADA